MVYGSMKHDGLCFGSLDVHFFPFKCHEHVGNATALPVVVCNEAWLISPCSQTKVSHASRIQSID